MLSLIDTNILVYRFDSRFPEKQAIATQLLRRGIADQSLRVPHQAIIEFVSATTRRRGNSESLLSLEDAYREAEELLSQFEILYPSEALVRMAIRGAATYQLNWFDANIWAYAEQFGMDEIITEDFEATRIYGSVTIHNPFL